jgi:alkylhydroperoxidase family enzyme
MTMNQFKTHDIASAPLEARTDLEKIKLNHGNVPNVYAVMAEAPVLLKGHIALKEQFEKATLNKQERKIVLLALSRELGSTYDTAVHSGAAEKHNVPMDAIEAIRAGAPLKDLKLEALRSFAAKLVNSRGHVTEIEVQAFLTAGYTRANILEIVLALGAVTLTSYTNLIAQPVLDAEFAAKVWKKAS